MSEPTPAGTGSGPQAQRRSVRRGSVVLGIVVVSLLAFGSTTQTWLTVALPQETVQSPDLMIAGSDAATPVTAFALVALAAAIAVSIAGRVARWIIAVILVLSGIGIVLSSAGVALDPAAAARPAIGAAIGVTTPAGADASATWLPWLAVVAGILLVLAAVWVVLAGRGWGSNRRYDSGTRDDSRGRAGEDVREAPVRSSGDVPPGVLPPDGVETAERAETSDQPGVVQPAARRRSAHADEIDSWDELSRGNDPT
ncbi:hypothetical protein E8P82_04760 [Arthrobacter echini]|uniref:Trp biosynthesis-associated membrane protein n=1 Tax=Arthrobacter echini TaxID=1529066 RepID=A0A4S5E751_9MICC|nr:Trp biosynthesis-associated membrane protein [Arthrobacter echini]THJ67417.1 hypothetical protein E8P82_04760 [Arthrobacter echini]